MLLCGFSFFFFNDTATPEIYTLSLHDALPISTQERQYWILRGTVQRQRLDEDVDRILQLYNDHGYIQDRKSTRLNSSHDQISYAVFCLKKKRNPHPDINQEHHSRVRSVDTWLS